MPRPLPAEELIFELRTVAAERAESATQAVALARRALMVLDAGQSPVRVLMELERLALREQARAGVAGDIDERAA